MGARGPGGAQPVDFAGYSCKGWPPHVDVHTAPPAGVMAGCLDSAGHIVCVILHRSVVTTNPNIQIPEEPGASEIWMLLSVTTFFQFYI